LGELVKSARTLQRELPFTMALPVSELDPHQAERQEQIIVQGVIDCLAELADGRLILIDYKTDAIAGEWNDAVRRQLVARYREQLGLYARAVKQLYQRPVDACYLYFFARDQSVTVPITE
jgi:ATP-dependent helicase/nuclease subunit A